MNRTVLLFALLALMFGAAVVVAWVAFTGASEDAPPEKREESAAAGSAE